MDNALVVYKGGDIKFANYDMILSQAQELAEHIANVEVNEESVKMTKKMLAEVNKKVNELEDGRKAIKKELLAPYEEFEAKIKSITSVVKQADSQVRSQVRELEERERQTKRDAIADLFNKRLRLYPMIDGVFAPSHFITNQMLNKSLSLSKIEMEMAVWFENKKQDIEFIQSLKNSEDVLVEYVNCQNIPLATSIVNERTKVKQQVTKRKEESVEINSVSIVIDENDLKTVEAFMKLSNINYTTKRGN